MAYPRHALQSVELNRATQIRVSDDHMPGVSGGNTPIQFKLGFSSMLAWALGLAPFKDNFWSTPIQPGSSQPAGSSEITPSLHAAVSVLSAGPVTPADGIGMSDAPLILRTCDASGRLLHPSRALTAIDALALAWVFRGPAAVTASPLSRNSVVYATYTLLGEVFFWDHVLAADLTDPFSLYPAHLYPTRADAVLRGGGGANALRSIPPLETIPVKKNLTPPPLLAYTLNSTSMDLSTLQVQYPFDDSHPIVLPSCGVTDFSLWHTAPLFALGSPGGVALLGELTKFVPVSEARFYDLQVGGDGISVGVSGLAGEYVGISFWVESTESVTTVQCTISGSGRSTLRFIPKEGGICAPV